MMRKVVILSLSTLLLLAICACESKPFPTSTMTISAPTTVPHTLTKVAPASTLTPTPERKTIVVVSAEDSGSGTLREAMQAATPGDIIAFDESVFPRDNPKTMYLQSTLPSIEQGYLTIDAVAAGVILDGSKFTDGWDSGIQVLSDNNVIKGLTLINFSGAALHISGGQNNLIESNVMGNSDFGIGVWGAKASGNRITANYLGVMPDGVTPLGNKTAGIIFMEEAHENQIGPDNQIAFNGRNGVEIYQAGTIGNTIIENSIHDNGIAGIAIWEDGNNSQAAPILMDYDLAMGSVSGMACPYCEVLFYSDASDEGAIYEGQTTADENGTFAFEKGFEFNGPFLTATATDAQGNTSGFSIPTMGDHSTMQIQLDNHQPRMILVTRPSRELEDNHLGNIFSDFWQPQDFHTAIESEIVPAGMKLVKITMNQAEYYSNEQSGVELYWDKPEFFISPEFDSGISQLVSNKINIYYMLNFWDKANHPDGWEIANRFETEEDIAHYLEYVRFIVSHFKGRVQYYELWNEPDAGFPLQYIKPEDYINLAKRTIPVIKEIDPQAKVVVGCTSGAANPQSREYLFKILNSDVMQIADVVSWHPLYGNIPDSGQYPEYFAAYPILLADIMDTARKNGFQGEFIAGEISYGGPQCGGCDVVDPTYTEVVWAKYTARGIILHFGNDVAVSLGGMSSQRLIQFNTIRNIANVFSGVRADEFAIEVQTESGNYKTFTFAGLDGSRLIALWTDGVAVNDDPGIPSTLTIPGFAGWNVTGIEVLNGFEQELISTNENENLIIHDFLMKDYPIIIRLSNKPITPTQTPVPLSPILQEGNELPRTLLQVKSSSELADNRIGGLCHPPWCVRDEAHINDEFFDLGLKGVLRLTLNEIESYSIEDWSSSEFNIALQDDEWVTYIGRNITLAYTLSFWDKANHPSGWEGISSRFKTEEEIQRYLEYVRFIVNHFKDRIHYYEIWNEPDIGYPFQHIEAADYINLAKRTIPVIKEIDPKAKIMVGSVSGFNNPASQDYLFEILQSDVMPMVDVVSWHPFFGASPQYDDVREYYYEYPSLVQEIKDLASAHGFVGEYSADELTWRTPLNADEGQPWTYSEIIAAKYYARAIVSHLGMDVSVGIMVDPRLLVIRSTTGTLCTLMVGAKPESLSIDIQSQSTNVVNYSFSLPDGDKLIVLWSNGVAVDDDLGILSTVTIPAFSNWKATGIDVLNGVEQNLITDGENDDLIIRDFLIKDYPIIIRLSKQ